MPAGVPEGHPLCRLFATLTERNFAQQLHWPDAQVIRYLSDVLVDFVHVDNLYKIRTAAGRRVEEVAEMLAEGDILLGAPSIDRERAVHKHIGDYTLFMAGLFPEYLDRLQRSGVVLSPDALLDHLRVGKRSYRIVSEFTYGPYGETAPLFRKLSQNYELCVFGLGYVRADLDRLRNPKFRQAREILMG